jgi:hypothetical protein
MGQKQVKAAEVEIWPPYQPQADTLDKLTRVYAYVLWFLA